MKNKPKELRILAKSVPEVPLQTHIDDCLAILRQLIISFPNLPLTNKEEFWKLLTTCIIFHDTGKAHKEFQKILHQASTFYWYEQRHELFSLYFINQANIDSNIKELVLYTVTGHHKGIEELKKFARKNYQREHSDMADEDELNFKTESKKLNQELVWKILNEYGYTAIEEDSFDIHHYLEQECRSYSINHKDFLFRLLLVGYLKQCDHLASAGIQYIKNLSLNDFDFLHQYMLYSHQEKACQIIGNVILSAPTGSGKTETALLWLRKQMEEKGCGRVFYTLPYTASINAMYERLEKKIGQGENKVGMVHGRLLQYIEYKMSTDSSSISEKKRLANDFKTLVTPLKIVTPFQLLKYLFGLKGFEKGMAEWSGSYFIFDEIHAYDAKTFAQILTFLHFITTYMNANVLIMTATLPTFMNKLLKEAIGKHSTIVADHALYASFIRHKIKLEEGTLESSLDMIQADIDAGKKVLVVCNTIEQAQIVYSHLYTEQKKTLLHGAFNAEDRKNKEKDLQQDDIRLLVGTQAIEVSLDLDFETIYTEPAPLDALIQRFGRINRKRKEGICLCHIFTDKNEKDKFIYNPKTIEETISVLKTIVKLDNGIIYENKVQKYMDIVYPKWEDKQQKDFDMTFSALSYFVDHSLSPLFYDEKKEELFYKQFDGTKVLPINLVETYDTYLQQKQFVKADGLLVSIRESKLFHLLKEESAYKESLYLKNATSDKLEYKTFFVIKRPYNSELGLVIKDSLMAL